MNGLTPIILLLMMGGMMFFTARGQKKQQQARLEMLNNVKPGDKVVTIGGLYGVVDSVDTEVNTVTLDIDGIYLTFERAAIRTVVSGGVSVESLSPADPAVTPAEGDSEVEEGSIIEE
ncbi:preprotein translocase subunit YajC [Streptococcus merionis]|uniref:Preprotein translocase subunit YajC n=1 Tax=Streptococcus merionis TaxID=400065 RepID=A0A239SYF4_9STRE|nr:preprotein translocase subunit YajC [Streptococcus merionis]SNU89603.1 preprotein translocase subunit YajC [Streptococcus merionis]